MTNFRYTKLIAALALLLAIISIIFINIKKQTAHADALWNIVHGRCLPDMQTNHNPAPCVSVDLPRGGADGFVVLKDSVGETQYLLIPTAKITGIESPAILEPNATNYFSKAWAATRFVEQQLRHPLPHTDLAIAINSLSGRSQNQLHIHVDCVRPEVKTTLEQVIPQVGTSWQMLPVKLSGHEYRAMWFPGAELEPRNPFRILADSLSNPTREMGAHTLVLVGAQRDGQDGFILLDRKAPAFAVALAPWIKLGFGSGEELEDHQCQVANGG
jgi:CDP-diacylglycerol pyrophosphatase